MVVVNHKLSALAGLSEAEVKKVISDHDVYTAALKKAGVLVSDRGYRLRPPTEMVRLEKDRGAVDGPHAETREVIGGFYLLEVKDKGAAIEWAKQHPTWAGDRIEIREVVDC